MSQLFQRKHIYGKLYQFCYIPVAPTGFVATGLPDDHVVEGVPTTLTLSVEKIKPEANIFWKIGDSQYQAQLEVDDNGLPFSMVGTYVHTFTRSPEDVPVSWIIDSDPPVERSYKTLPVWCKSG